jgi:hypothetical protein
MLIFGLGFDPSGRNLYGSNRPPTVGGGFVPDVFANDVPETHRIIAEAKTAQDCETVRSLKQIESFLRHLKVFPGKRFYLAVPRSFQARARFLLASIKEKIGAQELDTLVNGGWPRRISLCRHDAAHRGERNCSAVQVVERRINPR